MQQNPVILFDGVCNFCNFWVNFILEKDKDNCFRFAALQSEAGQELLKKFNLCTTDFDTFILIEDSNYFSKSTAAFLILKELKTILKIFYPFIYLPKPVRDFFYDVVAKNRYKIFGRRDVCRVPTESERAKFLS